MVDGERGAWLENAVAQWEKGLMRMCYAYLGDVALAEDAVQETFLKAWKGYGQFRGASNEKTWLMRIAINTCKDARRSAWFCHVDRSVAIQHLPEGAYPFTPRDDTITKTVMGLKPRLREVVLLHWYQGLTVEETADSLGVSRSTAYNRLKKAHGTLQKELEDWYREE